MFDVYEVQITRTLRTPERVPSKRWALGPISHCSSREQARDEAERRHDLLIAAGWSHTIAEDRFDGTEIREYKRWGGTYVDPYNHDDIRDTWDRHYIRTVKHACV